MRAVVLSELTDKQKLFCLEYAKDGNAKQAAIRAGYSERSAEMQGSRLMSIDKVKAYIQSIQNKVSKKVEVTRERVLAQYAKLAFYDIRNLYDQDGNLKPVKDLDDETAAAISGLEVEQKVSLVDDEEDLNDYKTVKNITATKKIRLTDMKAALDSICKMEGYNTPEAIITHGKVETIVTFKRG